MSTCFDSLSSPIFTKLCLIFPSFIILLKSIIVIKFFSHAQKIKTVTKTTIINPLIQNMVTTHDFWLHLSTTLRCLFTDPHNMVATHNFRLTSYFIMSFCKLYIWIYRIIQFDCSNSCTHFRTLIHIEIFFYCTKKSTKVTTHARSVCQNLV